MLPILCCTLRPSSPCPLPSVATLHAATMQPRPAQSRRSVCILTPRLMLVISFPVLIVPWVWMTVLSATVYFKGARSWDAMEKIYPSKMSTVAPKSAVTRTASASKPSPPPDPPQRVLLISAVPSLSVCILTPRVMLVISLPVLVIPWARSVLSAKLPF